MTQSGSEDQLTLFAADILASPLALPGSEEAIKMTDISGRRCLGLSKLSGPAGCVERMLLATSLWASTRCYLTFKAQVTKQGHMYYRLLPQMPRTDEIDAGLLGKMWATPRTTDGTGGPRKLDEKGRRISQSNPDLVFGANLADQVRMWPTPTARDYKDNGSSPAELARNSVTLETHAGGSLNPQFVEYLMGYPIGYTDLDS
tara:strand:+ start:1265 stop:1870 length:606 start_codon:yes stop_codon:yes gene_type:complete